MSQDLLVILLSAVLAAAGGWFVPRLVASVPEPEPVEPPEGEEAPEPEEPKEPYAAIAALPGLAWKSAVVAGLAGAVVGWAEGWSTPLLVLLPLVPLGVALGVIDWRTRLLPTHLIRPGYLLVLVLIAAGFVISRNTGGPLGSLIGFLVSFVFFFVLWWVYPRGLGYGDVRLAGLLGLALGYVGLGPLVVGLYGGFLLGGVGGGLLSLLRIVERRAFPFGPFMLVGALAGIAWGEAFWARLAAGG